MRAILAAVVLAIICCYAAADDLPEFIPCAFNVEFHTQVMNLDGEVVASSTDRVIHDNNIDLWRWDSDFTGFAGILDPQKWIVIWRPDLNASYHDLGDKCIKNNGRKEMAPTPYFWLKEKTYGFNWFRNLGTWEGIPSYIFHSEFVVKEYQTTMTANVHVLQKNGALVLVNGTAKSSKYGFDLTYAMDVEYYAQHQEFLPAFFIPSAHCTGGVPVSAPEAASQDFQKACYYHEDSEMGVRAVVSWIAVVLLAVAVLF